MNLDQTDRLLLDLLQSEFPLQRRPFNALAGRLRITEDEAIARTLKLKQDGVIRQIGAIFDSARLGYQSALMAFEIPFEEIDKAAEIINAHPGVSHNYLRDHAYSLWFTLAVPPGSDIAKHASILANMTGARKYLFLPTLRVFKIGVNFRMSNEPVDQSAANGPELQDLANAFSDRQQEESENGTTTLSNLDKKMIRLLQEDLLIVKEPFAQMAEKAGCSEGAILQKADEFLERGVMRRFAAILRHMQAGYRYNVLTLWSVEPRKAEAVGRSLASHPSVSHCYLRLPADGWPYNLYAMLHARSAEEVEAITKELAGKTGGKDFLALQTVKEFKKCRMKYFDDGIEEWEKANLL